MDFVELDGAAGDRAQLDVDREAGTRSLDDDGATGCGFRPDFGDAPRGLTDAAANRNYPDGWTELAPELQQPGDLTVTKHQWGAFHGTDLDVKLRRRGITTIVLGGIATNFGVESTARAGWEHGYNMVVLEDASTGVSAELHEMAFKFVFPRIARVVSTAGLTLG